MRFSAILAFALLCMQPTGEAQPQQSAGASPLHDYESCSFDDGLQIVTIDALPPGEQVRTVETAKGPKPIRMLDGRRILFAYGLGGDYYANVKPELLPADTWAIEKQALLDQIDQLLSSDRQSTPNKSLPREIRGLELHGFDRITLHGSVLGFYMLFDNERHIATSISLLNQGPLTSKFQTIEQYRQLRARFLTTYAGCIAQNQAMHAVRTQSALPDAKEKP